jgi:hypothetical protein
MTNWQERSKAKMDRKRSALEARGYAPAEANGLVEWALRMAQGSTPPEKNVDEFLRELDRKLAACDRLVKR